MRLLPRVLILLLSLSLLPVAARAQWILDGAPLCTAAGDQDFFAIIPDGAGGAFVTWRDFRSGEFHIYAQRVNAAGVPQWTPDGVAICTAANGQYTIAIISDDADGAIIAWEDYRSGNADVYVQRVNGAGVPQWTANGVLLCNAAFSQNYPLLVSDGAGGAIVAWQDYRSGTNFDVYARRVNAAGTPQWTANGNSVCAASFDQNYPQLVSDGAGGAILAWHDYRSGISDIYAQRVGSSGTPAWVLNGVDVCTAANGQSFPMLVSDGLGGAIITWPDGRNGISNDVYAQRLNAGGTPQWTVDGIGLGTATGNQSDPKIVTDGAGGAIVAWSDTRTGTSDIYARRVSAAGVPTWLFDGVPVCTAPGDQYYPAIASDGAGGAIIAWRDLRNGPSTDIFTQRVNASGTPTWAYDGAPVCTAVSSQYDPIPVSNDADGAIIAWTDVRTGTSLDVYIQRVEGRNGSWGRPEPIVDSVADIRNDQGGKVKVNWTASGWDVLGMQTITHYSIWRATDVAAAASAVVQNTIVRDPSRVAPDFAGAAVWVQHAPTTDYYWEWVGNQDMLNQKAYSFSASTRADSMLGSTATHYFMVAAHTWNTYTFWPSNAVGAHSVDNLAPSAPLFLAAQRAGADVQLRWNRVRVADLRDYAVYRKTSSGVTPVPINFLAGANDTVLVDAGAPASALYYIVTAYDVHANQSAPSNEAAVAPATGVGNLPPIRELMVLQNKPNPFTGSTDFTIGLPAPGDVQVEIFDVAGRRVAGLEARGLAAGWRKMSFAGRDDHGGQLASGVYFYRVHAGGATVTRKMVITR